MTFERFEWQLIADDEVQPDEIAHYTHRAKVLGGWLVKCTDVNQVNGQLTSTSCVAFIKDITHEWKLPQYE